MLREALQRDLANCDTKLARYRAALEAGTDPSRVAEWSGEVQGRRLAVEADLRALLQQDAARLSEDDVREMVEQVGDLVRLLNDADRADLRDPYTALGIEAVYDADSRQVEVTAAPAAWGNERVGGGS